MKFGRHVSWIPLQGEFGSHYVSSKLTVGVWSLGPQSKAGDRQVNSLELVEPVDGCLQMPPIPSRHYQLISLALLSFQPHS